MNLAFQRLNSQFVSPLKVYNCCLVSFARRLNYNTISIQTYVLFYLSYSNIRRHKHPKFTYIHTYTYKHDENEGGHIRRKVNQIFHFGKEEPNTVNHRLPSLLQTNKHSILIDKPRKKREQNINIKRK